MKRKILHIGKYYYPFKGGIETVTKEICETLKHEFEFTVLVSNSDKTEKVETINEIKVIRIPCYGKISNMPVSISFLKWLKRLDFDLIHVHMPTPLAELSCLLSNTNKKIIASYHSEMYKRGSILYKPFQKRFLRKVSRILAATKNHYIYSKVLQDFMEKVEVIPYSINENKFRDKANMVNPFSNLENSFNILYVGRLTEYKGVNYLIESMKYVDAGSIIHIVGTGKLENEYKSLVSRLKIEDRIIFHGEVDNDKLLGYYKYCDAVVLPSIDVGEAFGIVQLEGMASGKPVINTSLKSGAPLVSINNETGLTVPPKDARALADAIMKLKNDPALADKFGKNGIERISKFFSKEKIMGEYRELYYSLLD
ncbi:glycosyltransferase [candidate division KSB1 bacterium]